MYEPSIKTIWKVACNGKKHWFLYADRMENLSMFGSFGEISRSDE